MVFVPLCFMSRVPLILLNMAFPDLTKRWWWDLVYFTLLELVPLFLLLTALHMDTRKDREGIQYGRPPSMYSSVPLK